MLNITIYGPGCTKCKEAEKRVRHVVEQFRIEATVTHATDIAEIAKAGVLMTPAVAVNGVLKASGKIPNEDEIKVWLTA